jgi:threonine aldolase
LNFASDNAAGAAPEILAALVAASQGPAAAYGADPWSQRAIAQLAQVFETNIEAFLVPTGTGANALALSALARPWEAVFCHEEAHVHDDECGAPEFFTGGAKLVGIPGYEGKVTPEALARALEGFPRGVVKACQPATLSLSQVTEAGTVYSLDELAALCHAAHAVGLFVHMDGARFANAVVALGCSAAEMSWRAGIDALSFGATKNGALACEAVVFFDKRRAEAFPYLRKRGGHTLSKGRLLGAQMTAYIEDGLWLTLAARANGSARRLADGLAAIPGLRLAFPSEANEVFVIAPTAQLSAWRSGGAAFYEVPTRGVRPERSLQAGEAVARLVTSFETSEAEVESFLALARRC